MKRAFFLCAILTLVLAPAGYAMPDRNEKNDRFAMADTDKDGYCSREEFAKAFSGLKPEAFDLIDKDKDGRISRAEWGAFSSGHGGHTGTQEPAKQDGGSLPVVPVPQGAGK